MGKASSGQLKAATATRVGGVSVSRDSLVAINSTGRKSKTTMLQINLMPSGPEATLVTKASEHNISGCVKLLRKVKTETECMV